MSEFEFHPDEIARVSSEGRLLSLEIELSLACNFRCRYCYVAPEYDFSNELSYAEICDVILQAKELGALKIILLGGEPMIYPRLKELVVFITEQELETEIFTNGTNITPSAAAFFYEKQVRVVLKMNSFKASVQNELASVPNAYEIIQAAYKNLSEAGYPSEGHMLAISTIICRQNLDELPALWRWAREQGVAPYLEMITPQGEATKNDDLHVDSATVEQLFKTIEALDADEFGKEWVAQPPLVGSRCLRHQYSCMVNATGFVQPCVGVTIPVGNIRETPLKTIIQSSEVIRDLRNFQQTIHGPCHTCEKAETCYGCRGAAYQMTGDYLGSDPLCWRNQPRQGEIDRLPVSAEGFIPQFAPMRMVDALIELGEREGVCIWEVSADCPLVDEFGVLDETAFFEIIAQSSALYEGFRTERKAEKRIQGFLLGAKSLKIEGTAHVGDLLRIHARKVGEFAEFSMVEGVITRDGERLACGTIKLFQKTNASAEGTTV